MNRQGITAQLNELSKGTAMTDDELKNSLPILRSKFLKDKTFSIRKQANAITAKCFRNTVLEDYHCQGYITDNEMKNTSIETSARLEYLMLKGTFDTMKPKDIFAFAFEKAYNNHVKKALPKANLAALKKDSYKELESVIYMKNNKPVLYEGILLINFGFYASYYDENIKFDGKKLSDNPDKIKIGHQHKENPND